MIHRHAHSLVVLTALLLLAHTSASSAVTIEDAKTEEGKEKKDDNPLTTETCVNGNPDGLTIMRAAEEGKTCVVEYLIESKEDVNVKDEDGWSALMNGAFDGHLDVVKLLLGAEGINVNQAKNDGKTALSIAKQEGYTEIVQLLTDAGAK